MTRTEFLNELEDMLELDAGTLTGAEALEDIDSWDSLAVISYIALVDETFDVTVEGGQLAAARTINDLIKLIGADLAA